MTAFAGSSRVLYPEPLAFSSLFTTDHEILAYVVKHAMLSYQLLLVIDCWRSFMFKEAIATLTTDFVWILNIRALQFSSLASLIEIFRTLCELKLDLYPYPLHTHIQRKSWAIRAIVPRDTLLPASSVRSDLSIHGKVVSFVHLYALKHDTSA